MKFHTALAQRDDIEQKREALDASYDAKLNELRTLYEQRKEQMEKAYTKAADTLEQAADTLSLDDPRVLLGSRAVRIVGDWSLAGRDGAHCCAQAALNIALTEGECLGMYSYCTLTRGPIHGVYEVLAVGTQPAGNGVPLFRIEGTPEVIHRLRHGTMLPESVVEAATYFVHHLPSLFAMGWRWESALQDDRDLFAGKPEIAEALTGIFGDTATG